MKSKRIYFETEEVVKRTRRGWIEIDMDFVQMYSIAYNYIGALKRTCSKDFILWVLAKVDSDNKFTFSRDMFNEFNLKNTEIKNGETYSYVSVERALKELQECKIIRKIQKAVYQVNPAIFWNSSLEKRINTVKLIGKETESIENVLGEPIKVIETATSNDNSDLPSAGPDPGST